MTSWTPSACDSRRFSPGKLSLSCHTSCHSCHARGRLGERIASSIKLLDQKDNMIKNELFEAKRFQDAQLLVKEVEAGIQRSPEVMEDVLAIMQRNDENLQAWMSILTNFHDEKRSFEEEVAFKDEKLGNTGSKGDLNCQIMTFLLFSCSKRQLFAL